MPSNQNSEPEWKACTEHEVSGQRRQKDGQPLPHQDVSATRLHGGLDTTSQVTST
jgi:hypothetical protein